MYLTAAEDATITGRSEDQATTQRIKQSCMLLDARLGMRTREDNGWKVDMTDVEDYQSEAIKQWVAYMILYLFDNSDTAPSTSNLTLGKFSVSGNTEGIQGIPNALSFVDSILVSSELIRTEVKMK